MIGGASSSLSRLSDVHTPPLKQGDVGGMVELKEEPLITMIRIMSLDINNKQKVDISFTHAIW